MMCLSIYTIDKTGTARTGIPERFSKVGLCNLVEGYFCAFEHTRLSRIRGRMLDNCEKCRDRETETEVAAHLPHTTRLEREALGFRRWALGWAISFNRRAVGPREGQRDACRWHCG